MSDQNPLPPPSLSPAISIPLILPPQNAQQAQQSQYTGQQAHPNYSSYYDQWGWQRSWQSGAYPYGHNAYTQSTQYLPHTYMHQPAAGISAHQSYLQAIPKPSTPSQYIRPAVETQVPSKTRTPTPPVELMEEYKHWDEALRAFFEQVKLTETLRGLEADMLVLNPFWEAKIIPRAIKALIERLSCIQEKIAAPAPTDTIPEVDKGITEALSERKLKYINFVDLKLAQTPTSVNRSISAFLAANKSRNNASNRMEFLKSIQREEKPLSDEVETKNASCARLDAKTIDREEQMKYDIVKNEDGPLSKTMKQEKEKEFEQTDGIGPSKPSGSNNLGVIDTAKRFPALDERLRNAEQHLAVRYVPTPPRTLTARLKFLEDHIIKLEKEYPPWAALHFNQPSRGWPPPPLETPIIVPAHLRQSENLPSTQSGGVTPSTGRSAAATKKVVTSSLQRAVLEKLEVQQAMNDLATK